MKLFNLPKDKKTPFDMGLALRSGLCGLLLAVAGGAHAQEAGVTATAIRAVSYTHLDRANARFRQPF